LIVFEGDGMQDTHTLVKAYPKHLDWLRYFCAFQLYIYGMSKLAHLQFSLGPKLINRPIGSLTGYELTWYYFGYSRTYACVLGMTQVLGATLLLFRKATFLGAAMMMPVMANIVLINIFIMVRDYGAELMAILIFTSLLTILCYDRARFIAIFWDQQSGETVESRRRHLYIRACIVIAALSIILAGAYHNAHS
jgi:hypothetical protein